MTKRWLVVAPEGKVTVRSDPMTLATLQAAVGGYVEARRLPAGRGYMYMDEDGLRKGLRINPIATEVSGNFTFIVGTVVLVGPPDGSGNETSVPRETAALVRKLARSWVVK